MISVKQKYSNCNILINPHNVTKIVEYEEVEHDGYKEKYIEKIVTVAFFWKIKTLEKINKQKYKVVKYYTVYTIDGHCADLDSEQYSILINELNKTIKT